MSALSSVLTFVLLFRVVLLRFSGVLRRGSIKGGVETKGGGLSSTVFKIMK